MQKREGVQIACTIAYVLNGKPPTKRQLLEYRLKYSHPYYPHLYYEYMIG